ncbi:MAG TPA: thermonuclease family protein [Candidatus Obscuribacterales bacterium]|nr:thermonuclease family protein [Candidatus Obscuribacterales bacterium]
MKALLISLALVVSVHDGDTLKLSDGRTIRLEGIDAPEIAQPYGIESRDLLAKLTRRKKVRIESRGKDRYGRTFGKIYVGRRSVNQSMVGRGAAWWFRSFAPTDNQLRRLEQDARKHKVGLWKSSKAIAPWDWRKLNDRRARIATDWKNEY